MADLLECKVCHGRVASDAKACPHCGSPNYKNDEYLAHERKAQEEHRLNAQREYQERFGYPISFSIYGINEPTPNTHPHAPDNKVRYGEFFVDGESISEIRTLRAGNHTVSLSHRWSYDHIDPESKLTFTTTPNTRKVVFYYRYFSAGLFGSPYFALERVEQQEKESLDAVGQKLTLKCIIITERSQRETNWADGLTIDGKRREDINLGNGYYRIKPGTHTAHYEKWDGWGHLVKSDQEFTTTSTTSSITIYIKEIRAFRKALRVYRIEVE